jgi:hypothetical protein
MELMLLLYEVLLFLVVIFGNIELHHSCTANGTLFETGCGMKSLAAAAATAVKAAAAFALVLHHCFRIRIRLAFLHSSSRAKF